MKSAVVVLVYVTIFVSTLTTVYASTFDENDGKEVITNSSNKIQFVFPKYNASDDKKFIHMLRIKANDTPDNNQYSRYRHNDHVVNLTLENIIIVHKGHDDNSSTISNRTGPVPTWLSAFDIVQTVATVIGIITNLFVWIFLARSVEAGDTPLVTLLKHQAFVDAVVCTFTLIIILQKFMWLTGNPTFDLIVCQVWHTQTLYWLAVFVSAQGLVCIAAERYVAVCRPFLYLRITFNKIIVVLVGVYSYALIVVSGTLLQARYSNGKCTPQLYSNSTTLKDFYSVFSFIWCFTFYVVPCITFCILYVLVLKTLRERKNKRQSTGYAESDVVNKASSGLTKTAITVTIIFVLSMAYDSIYYILGLNGFKAYEVNTPFQKIGVFLATLNSVANPFVYAILMPVFRTSMRRTINRLKKSRVNKVTPQTSESSDSSLPNICK